jgi:hypothetical protein
MVAFTTHFDLTAGGATIQVPLGVHVGLWLQDNQVPGTRSFWNGTTAHYNGFNNAMGRTATTVAMVGSNGAPFAPGNIGDAGYATEQAVYQSTTIPKLTLLFSNGSADNDYTGWSNGSRDAALNTVLVAWRNLGYTRMYIRINWEFNDNFLDHGVTSTGQIPTFIAAWKRTCNLIHTFANNNGIKIKTVWCPTCSGGAANSTNNSLNQPIMSFFPQPDVSAVNLNGQATAPGTGFGKYIDVIGPDMYAFGWNINNPFTADPNTNINTATNWYFNNYVKMCQQFGCTMAISELGDFAVTAGVPPQNTWQTWIPTTFTNGLNALKNLSPAVPIEYLCLFDLTELGAKAFSHSSDNQPNQLAAWKTAIGGPLNAGSITTIPAIW